MIIVKHLTAHVPHLDIVGAGNDGVAAVVTVVLPIRTQVLLVKWCKCHTTAILYSMPDLYERDEFLPGTPTTVLL